MTDRELAGCALLPCPFCGGTPVRDRRGLSEVYAYADQVTYKCSGCGVERSAIGDTSKRGYADNSTVEQRAIAAWNRRTPSMDEVRYRWLRLRLAGAEHVAELVEFNTGMHPELPGNVDAAIDAAIAAAEGERAKE